MTETEKLLQEAVYFVECTDTEYEFLREKHTDINWEHISYGFYRHIGHIDVLKLKHVGLQFSFAKIYGHLVCFYEAASRYVDYTMVDSYIRKNYKGKLVSKSSRFAEVILYCKELKN